MSARDVPLTILAIGHIPARGFAIAGAAAFVLATIPIALHVLRNRHWWALVLPIGTISFAFGFLVRSFLTTSPDSMGIFIAQELFVLCSPAAFLAFNYILFGRIAVLAGAHHSFIRPEILAKVFVISDAVTFLVQMGGGGMSAAQSLASTGRVITLVGLILQTSSYFLFMILAARAYLSMKKESKLTGAPWWKAFHLLGLSSIFVAIRCIYRMIELAQGRTGYLVKHEAFFLVFDALSLLAAVSVYIPVWPGTRLFRPEDYNMTSGHRTKSWESSTA